MFPAGPQTGDLRVATSTSVAPASVSVSAATGRRVALRYTAIALLNATAVTYYALVMVAYASNSQTRSLLSITRFVTKYGDPVSMTLGVGVFAVAHAALLLQQLLATLWLRRAALRVQIRVDVGFRSCCRYGSSQSKQQSTTDRCCARVVRRLKTSLQSLAASLRTVDYIFVDLAWLVRELFQIGFQTVQAYNISRVITSPWLRHAIVFALCANCWSTPLLSVLLLRRSHRVTPATAASTATAATGLSSRTHREYMAAALLVDALLEATTFWIIPLAIIAPSVHGVSWNEGTWDATLEWKMLEIRLVLPSSHATLLSNAMFATLMLFAVASLELPRETKSTVHIEPQRHRSCATADATSTTRTITQRILSSASVRLTKHHSKLRNAAHSAFVLWGVLVLAAHCHAWSRLDVPGCTRQLRPWFKSEPTCVVLRFDCYRAGHDGGAAAMDNVLRSLNAMELRSLTALHCLALDVSSRMQSLHSLEDVQLYNTTVHSWGSDAAVSDRCHPKLNYLVFVRVSFPGGALPVGLASAELPQALSSVAFAACQLDVLPETLPVYWSSLQSLFLESCGFTSVPTVVIAMDLTELSLMANHITVVPHALFGETKNLEMLYLSGNPIAALPELDNATEIPHGFWKLEAAHTNVSVVPSWVQQGFSTVWGWSVDLSSTPACETIGATLTHAGDEWAAELEWMELVQCYETALELLFQVELWSIDRAYSLE
ncbi:hypothetical protein PINS_up016758 [Pythium insidiosum]|nr:hypothetical protein PINS_up016758 [Pythium insidiosum]